MQISMILLVIISPFVDDLIIARLFKAHYVTQDLDEGPIIGQVSLVHEFINPHVSRTNVMLSYPNTT
jgi:hypothetical protein